MYRIEIKNSAWAEIQEQVRYYEIEQEGLGCRFIDKINEHKTILEKFPLAQIRYSNVRCIPLKKFPFMIHFTVDESNLVVIVQAVLHTSLDPDRYWNNDDWHVSEPVVIYGVAG